LGPAYFAGHPKPLHPRDLAAHNCIRRRFQSGRIYRWELERDGHAVSVGVNGNLILPQQELMRQPPSTALGWLFCLRKAFWPMSAQAG